MKTYQLFRKDVVGGHIHYTPATSFKQCVSMIENDSSWFYILETGVSDNRTYTKGYTRKEIQRIIKLKQL
jgi:hypothetical protein